MDATVAWDSCTVVFLLSSPLSLLLTTRFVSLGREAEILMQGARCEKSYFDSEHIFIVPGEFWESEVDA